MASAEYTRAPPAIKNCKTYKDWKKLISIWSSVTALDKTKQASAVVLTLEGEAQDAALEIESTKLGSDTGLEELLKRLDLLYVKDEVAEKYNALENLETYKRQSGASIRDFIIEFEKRNYKVKAINVTIPDDLLAYRLLKSANLDTQKEQLVKATISDLKYEDLKAKLLKIFTDEKVPIADEIPIKEEVFHTKEEQSQETSEEDEENNDQNTYYVNNRRKFSKNKSFNRNQPNPNWRSNKNNQETNWRSNRSQVDKRSTTRTAKNPPGKDGNITRCDICESINHWAQDCPDRSSRDQDTYLIHEIVLMEEEYQDPEKLKQLVSETWNNGLLDCGASKTVCGDTWLREYIKSLSDDERANLKYEDSRSFFKFGDGQKVKAEFAVRIPAFIGKKYVFISSDVVKKDIPLLLSKAFMKHANIVLDFTQDMMIAFGQSIQLYTTFSGHYILPLTQPAQLLANVDKPSTQITLAVRSEMSNKDIAIKLHRQFAHPTKERLLSLLCKAGKTWSENTDLIKEVKEISDNCDICKKYKKTPARPVVGLPMASMFLETVAMDLKEYHGNLIIHLIDLCTRLSAAIRIKNKKPETIIQAIFQIWIQVYGSTEKFLVDNGGEFANPQFIDMTEKFGITVKTTAAYSPWSNGTVERHNGLLAETLDKVIAETGCNIDLAIAWSVNAKNSLANVNGFTPYQISIGTNPKLPSLLNDKLPALTAESTSEIVCKNLEILHSARKAFLESENSSRLRRAISRNIRTSGDTKYVTGDSVYYKRNNQNGWHGPGRVIGQDGQNVLVKHGSYYVRVHPCRVQLIDSNVEGTRRSPNQNFDKNCIFDKNSLSKISVLPSSTPHSVGDVGSQKQNRSQSSAETSVLDSMTICTSGNKNTQDSTIGSPDVSNLENNSVGSDTLAEEHNTSSDDEESEDGPYSTDNDHGNSSTNKVSDTIGTEVEQRSEYTTNEQRDRSVSQLCDQLANFQPDTGMNLSQLRPGMSIKYNNEKGQNVSAIITTRAGKSSGKHRNWWNIIHTDGTEEAVDFSCMNDININNTPNSTLITQLAFIADVEEGILKAKLEELLQWESQEVYTEIEDHGQETMSVTWVVRPKVIDGVSSVKARLCARGFEEEQLFRTDSPTASREGNRLTLAMIASNGWTLNSLDVKTAFLQGQQIDRDILIKPPKEAKTTKLWKLNKTVYGLADASRSWYLKLKQELIKLYGKPMELEGSIFCWYDDHNNLQGIMGCFVDDVIWGGTEAFTHVINKLKKTFRIGSESTQSFMYVGSTLTQDEKKNILVNQDEYTSSLEYINLLDTDRSDKHRLLSEKEKKRLRSILGQLNWVACTSRPEISFAVSELSSKVKKATVNDILDANKVVKFVKTCPAFIKIPNLDIDSIRVASYSDASFNNLGDGGSQGAYIIFLYDKSGQCVPVSWSSNRIKRVVRSTLAAETLAFTEGADSAFYVANLLEEILSRKDDSNKINIDCFTDSLSLFEVVGTSSLTQDRRLRVEISAIRQMVDKDEINVNWVDKQYQLSDCLTKKGASPVLLQKTLKTAMLP